MKNSLECIITGDYFLNTTPAAKTLRLTMNDWDLLKLTNFCKAKDTVNKTKQQPREWTKIFINPIHDSGFLDKLHNELKELDIEIPNNSIK